MCTHTHPAAAAAQLQTRYARTLLLQDEVIHRLQMQLQQLEDELRLAAKGGAAAANELLQAQLNGLEVAHADLQEEVVSRPHCSNACSMRCSGRS